MKPSIRFLLVFLLLLSGNAFAERSLPPGKGVCVGRDASVTNIPPAYGSAGAAIFTGLSGKSGLEIYNPSSNVVWGSTTMTTTNCTGGVDNFFIPPSSGVILDQSKITINSVVCLRSSTGSAITTGLFPACVR